MVDVLERNKIVQENMGLVMSIALRFKGRGVEFDDLVQIGSIGLIKAVSNFDPSFNTMLSTYAVPMIAGEIRRFLRDNGPVKVSRHLKECAYRGRKVEEQLRTSLGRDPKISEISKASGISEEELICAFEANSEVRSIYETVHENVLKLDQIVGEDHEEDILNKVIIDEILKALPERERQILVLRYMKGKTQSETSKIIGVSQVQISRIEKKALETIRMFYAEHMKPL